MTDLHIRPLIGGLLAVLLATPGTRAEMAGTHEFDATFRGKVSVVGVEINGRLRVDPSDGTHVYVRDSEPRGFLARTFRRDGVRECARFGDGESGLVALSYEYRDGDDFGGKSSRIRFDHEAGLATSEYRGETVTLPLDGKPVYDRLTEELAASRIVAGAPQAFSMRVIERNALHDVAYRHIAGTADEPVIVETELGRYETLVYERRRGTSSRTSRIWYAAELDYMPVKIERFKEGDRQGGAELTAFERVTPQARGSVTPVCP